MKKTLLFVFLLFSYTAKSQLSLVNSFNPAATSGLCALGFDAVQNKLWVYECNGDSIYCLDTNGVYITAIEAPGEVANDVDIEIAPATFQMSGTTIPQGSILFINGETSSAEVYAINPSTGAVLDTLFTAFGNSHVVGGAYHIPSGTMFMVQDNVPGATLGNRIGEVNVADGSFIQDFSISTIFNVSYGDMEGAENGNLYVVSSVEDSIMELTTQGSLVQKYDLPSGVSSISGFDFDCGGAAIWACSTVGNIYHLGQSNCNSATGISEGVLSGSALYAFPNPSGDVFRLNKAVSDYMIFDVLGNVITNSTLRVSAVDLTPLPSGVYFFQTTGYKTIRLMKL